MQIVEDMEKVGSKNNSLRAEWMRVYKGAQVLKRAIDDRRQILWSRSVKNQISLIKTIMQRGVTWPKMSGRQVTVKLSTRIAFPIVQFSVKNKIYFSATHQHETLTWWHSYAIHINGLLANKIEHSQAMLSCNSKPLWNITQPLTSTPFCYFTAAYCYACSC